MQKRHSILHTLLCTCCLPGLFLSSAWAGTFNEDTSVCYCDVPNTDANWNTPAVRVNLQANYIFSQPGSRSVGVCVKSFLL